MNKLALSLLSATFALSAQTPPDLKTLSGGTMALYMQTRRALIGAAEKMPAEHYGFAPTDGVRNFGQMVGHVADAQYPFQPYFESGFPYGHSQWISAAGSSWALMSLMLTAPESKAGI